LPQARASLYTSAASANFFGKREKQACAMMLFNTFCYIAETRKKHLQPLTVLQIEFIKIEFLNM